MSLQFVIDILSDLILLIGLFFVFLGMVGLIRMPDVYNRLHTTTKIGTLGAFGVMISLFVRVGFEPIGIKALTLGLFLMLTAPIAAHMIGRAAFHHGSSYGIDNAVIDDYKEACERLK
ncbi:monovalent cation/H(+) antiporter subunit G [Methanosalsum natronophilum]|uniref:Monovalent cation/H(+) antiporter subunit G n=1 Tax=Methanosalsum natronophilum TaxID=768733 RepID=A0A3R7XV17_9EURY|nr:monovalent cation/H(+) antiporter subunit G [Methanosalsum natronophilum]MCS3924194.1 multicomponent Na+:H+ antiporter subunit G [Methanosalsum natronophilum]RQD87527.1 MAG: monovalent cation/H(+) antiporter subunit G [Methanosalsum natronophilum]